MKKFLTITAVLCALGIGLFLVFSPTKFGHIISEINKIERNLTDLPARCDGMEKTGNFADDMMNCRFPFPPLGRWKAVYTAEFAEEYNLPPENITTNLSDGVDYMEMETLPRTEGKEHTICMVNMLVEKPHDISLVGEARYFPKVPKDRKLLHLIDIGINTSQLKSLAAVRSSSDDYIHGEGGFAQTVNGVYAEDVLPNHDYFSIAYNCRSVSMHPSYYPNKYALNIRKASIWGKYDMKYNGYSDPTWPKDITPDESRFFVKIPEELILSIFQGIPIGGN